MLALMGSVLFIAFAALAQSAREMMRYVDTGQISGFTVLVTVVSLLGLAVYAIASALRRREAVVGTDGIAYKKTLTTEIIPYGKLARAVRDTRGVRLVRKERAGAAPPHPPLRRPPPAARPAGVAPEDGGRDAAAGALRAHRRGDGLGRGDGAVAGRARPARPQRPVARGVARRAREAPDPEG